MKSQISFDLENKLEDWRKYKFAFPKNSINLATLFSGIGAIEQAFKRLKLKHQIVFAGDIDKNVKASYFSNYKIDEKNWHDDITTFNAKKYKYKVDLLVGGSPCQSFSMVGHKAGLEDARGTLFYDFARVIKDSKPKVFIFLEFRVLIAVLPSTNSWIGIRAVVKSGKLLLSKLEELQKSYPDLILKVQGTGLIISCEINSKVKVVAEKGLEYRLRCHGLGIIHGGTNCLRLTPHFMLSEDEINLIIKVLDKVLLQYYSS